MSAKEQAPNASPVSHPVPFGHVPYTPALPGAMGPLWDWPTEWWYYCGWAHDKSNSKKFTVLIQAARVTISPTERENTVSAVLYAIGTDPTKPISTQCSAGFGFSTTPGKTEGLIIPPTTATSWSLTANTVITTMACELTSGTLGLPGAQYKLVMTDEQHNVRASFVLKDLLGMVLEQASEHLAQSVMYPTSLRCQL